MAQASHLQTSCITLPSLRISNFFAAFLLLTTIAQAQANPNQAAIPEQTSATKPAEALDRVKRDDVGTGVVDASSYIRQAAGVGPAKAIPVLEAFYARHSDPEFQAEVAWVLVWLGDKDEKYWKLVFDQATTVVESEVPSPFKLDGTAPVDKAGELSPELRQWAKAHNFTTEAAYRAASYDLPGKFKPLAHTGDPRGIPLLRRALHSPNFLIQILAASGLAEAHDESSVPLIIDTINQSPMFVQVSLAHSLLFFDDSRAQQVFRLHFPEVDPIAARRSSGGHALCCYPAQDESPSLK